MKHISIISSIVLMLCVAFYLAMSNHANASESHPQVQVDRVTCAYQIVEKDGTVTGIATEKVEKLLADLQLNAKVQAMPWARAYKTALTEPNTLIFSIVRTPKRESLFHWLGVLVSTKTYLISLRDRTDIQLQQLADLTHYKMAVKRDDVVFQYLSGKAVLGPTVVLPNTLVTVKILLKGRADIIAVSPLHLDYMCQKIGCKRSDFRFLLELEELNNDFYLAANKQTDPELVTRIKTQLKIMRD